MAGQRTIGTSAMTSPVMTRSRSSLFSFATIASIPLIFLFAFPHSFQAASMMAFALLISISIGALLRGGWGQIAPGLVPFMLVLVGINIAYIAVGSLRGAPLIGSIQALLVFVMAPLGWMFIGSAIRTNFTEVEIYKLFERAAFASCVAVAIFFTVFLVLGREAASIFVDNPNVLIAEGSVSATMHVYASLIFLSAFMLAIPDIYRKGPIQFLVPLAVIVAAVTSGRSALLVACVVGIAAGLVLRPFIQSRSGVGNGGAKVIRMIFFSVIFGGLFLIVIGALGVVDLAQIYDEFLLEVLAGGGVERVTQYEALLAGIEQNGGLGAGHGIGVSYVRDFEYPWRYEIFALSALYRLGFFGLALSFAPFAYYLFRFFEAAIKRKLTELDVSLFVGWLAMALAAFSNPYPESFIFQGLLYLPVFLFSYPLNHRSS